MQTGSKIGRYEIRDKIGSGGMGEVYLAKDTELDRLVALKVLRPSIAGNEELVRRFVQEAKAASALNHPNILTVHEIGIFEDTRFIATEFVEGKTLRERLDGDKLTFRETLEAILQVAAALDAAHNAGIVHRDIKPENIMIRQDGLVKILDFGLAKLTQQNADGANPTDATQFETTPGMVMGTPSYMSPEQARARPVDARSDIWSTGVVFYEMLAKRLPFPGATLPEVAAAILTKEPEPLDENIPAELQRIIIKSVQKKRDERYQTVKELLIDVGNLKRALEFSQEIELSYGDEFPNSTNIGALATNAGNLSGIPHTTQRASSAEYFVSEVRKHKYAAGIALALLLLLVSAGLGYRYLLATQGASINSVAVLPFANVGNDPNSEYLSDGLTESLINNLSQLTQLKVIARTSAFQIQGEGDRPAGSRKGIGCSGDSYRPDNAARRYDRHKRGDDKRRR